MEMCHVMELWWRDDARDDGRDDGPTTRRRRDATRAVARLLRFVFVCARLFSLWHAYDAVRARATRSAHEHAEEHEHAGDRAVLERRDDERPRDGE